jgi:hypothetical protein
LADQEPVKGSFPVFRRASGGPGPEPGPVFFGAFVDFEGTRLAVVSTFANAVYIFDRQNSEWVYSFRLVPAAGDTFQRRTVAMSGEELLLGSPGELGGGYLFLFDLSP